MENVQLQHHEIANNRKIIGLLMEPVKCSCDCHRWRAFNSECVCTCDNPRIIYPEWEQRIDLREKIYLISLFSEQCKKAVTQEDVESWVTDMDKILPEHIGTDINKNFSLAKMESEKDVRDFKRKVFEILHAFL